MATRKTKTLAPKFAQDLKRVRDRVLSEGVDTATTNYGSSDPDFRGVQAKLTSRSGSAYAWEEVYRASDGTWTTVTGGRSGTTTTNPAYEQNGMELEIPDEFAGVVTLFRCKAKTAGDKWVAAWAFEFKTNDQRWNDTTKAIDVSYDGGETWVMKVPFGACEETSSSSSAPPGSSSGE
jgi:hypothetical protein